MKISNLSNVGMVLDFVRQNTPTHAPAWLDADQAVNQPRRIQLSRKQGWRKPANTVVVARPGQWGNPYKVTKDCPVERAVVLFEEWLLNDDEGMETLRTAKIELRGKSLACWCKPGQPCHGDVLLRLVNDGYHF
jgi:hypothetical protein